MMTRAGQMMPQPAWPGRYTCLWLFRQVLQGAVLCALVFFARDADAVTHVGSSSAAVNADSISIAPPAGVQDGDIMVAQISFRGGTGVTVTPPAGWTLIRRDDQTNALGQVVYYRVATAPEPVDYTWGFGASARRAVGTISAYANVDTNDPIDVDGGQTTASSTSITAPSVTTTVANTLLVGMFSAAWGNAVPSAPSGMSERAGENTKAGQDGVGAVMADEAFVSPGATGTRAGTAGDNADNIGQLVALRPAPAGAPVQVRFYRHPSNTEVDVTISPSVTARVEDANGIVVSDSTASITITIAIDSNSNAAGGTLSGTTTVAVVNGVATFSDLSIDQIGNGYTLIATSGSLDPDISDPFNITPLSRGFNAFETDTPGGEVNGVIRTKIAGEPFALDIVAIADDGTVNMGYGHPVVVELLDASDNSGALDGNGCRSSWSIIQTINGDFRDWVNGRGRIEPIQENESWPVTRIRVRRPEGQRETGCSTNAFAIRPDAFINVQVTDADWESAGIGRALDNTSASGGVVHKAGAPFHIEATAINALGDVVTNYISTPDVVVNCTVPGSGNCVNGAVDPGTWSVSNGDLWTDAAVYSEAGVFLLTIEDRDFAAVDNGDGSTEAERYIRSASINAGRFVPDRFELYIDAEPELLTFDDGTCSGRAFTYIGQPFGYGIAPGTLVRAVNVAGDVTRNYSYELWKLDGMDVTQDYAVVADPDEGQTLDLSQIGLPNVTSSDNGTGIVTSSSADHLAFQRDAVAPADDPPLPFTADITLSVDLSDSSEMGGTGDPGNQIIGTSGPVVFDGSGSGGIVFDQGNVFRYGRLRVVNAIGPENRDLNVPVRAETWREIGAGSTVFGWMTDGDDSCTGVAATDFTLDDPAFTTIGAFAGISAGQGALTLNASNNPGTVDVTAGLESAGFAWLRFDWNGDGTETDAVGRAAFGFHAGNPRRLYQREQF